MAIIASDPNLTNAPPGWSHVDSHLGAYKPVADLGLVGTPGDINRFWSRYRLAKSFAGVQIDGFVADTVRGYSKLFHAVNSKVQDIFFALYRDFPDATRAQGQEKF